MYIGLSLATDKPNQASNNSTEASQLSNDVESTPEKIKPPKLEDKPFKEFIVEDFIPAIETSLRKFDVPSQTICFEESQF